MQETMWKPIALQIPLILLPLVFLFLVPKRREVEEVQKVLAYLEKGAASDGPAKPGQFDLELA